MAALPRIRCAAISLIGASHTQILPILPTSNGRMWAQSCAAEHSVLTAQSR